LWSRHGKVVDGAMRSACGQDFFLQGGVIGGHPYLILTSLWDDGWMTFEKIVIVFDGHRDFVGIWSG
jgi:hypothetical protein